MSDHGEINGVKVQSICKFLKLNPKRLRYLEKWPHSRNLYIPFAFCGFIWIQYADIVS